MKLKIDDFKEVLDHTLNFDFYIDKMEDVEIIKPVHVTGKAINNNGKITIDAHYSTDINTQCVRCLKENVMELSNDFVATFLETEQYKQYLKGLNDECEISQDEIYDEVVNGEIDLSSLVREYIILDLPVYPRCIPNCEDDSELEKYKDDGIDPRWQQLLQIKN